MKKLLPLKISISAWTIALLASLLFSILRLFGRIKVKGLDWKKIREMRERSKSGGIAIVSNHPSMFETLVLPTLFFPRSLFSWKNMPVSTPDIHFFNSWWFAVFRWACIPIPRGHAGGEGRAALTMKDHLSKGGSLVVFAEGGRTYKGSPDEMLFSKTCARIRPFKTGLASVFEKSDSVILPAWTEGGEKIIPNAEHKGSKRSLSFPRLWGKMTIDFGEPFLFNSLPEIKRMTCLEQRVFAVADYVKQGRRKALI